VFWEFGFGPVFVAHEILEECISYACIWFAWSFYSIALHYFLFVFYPESILNCFCCLSHFILVIILKLVLLGCVWIPHFILWSKEEENEGELWTVCTYEQSKHKWWSWYNVLKFETILGYLLQFHGFHWQKKICNSIAWWSFGNAIEWEQSQKIGILDGRCRGAGCWLCHHNRRHPKQPLPCNCSGCQVSESWLFSYTTNL
jgi:hypothetical protein